MSEVANIPQLRFSEFSGEWEEKKLGELCKFTQGVQIPFSEQLTKYKEGAIRYLYIRDFFTDDFPYYVKDQYPNKVIHTDEIMMVNTGNTAGKAFMGATGVLSNNAFKVSFDKTKVSNIFLFQRITSDTIQRRIKSFFNAGGQPHLGHKNIAIIPMGFASLKEQQKIAAFLTAVDNKIEQLSKKQALLGSWKKGLMQQIFSQAIRFKADDGSAFPVWEEKNIVELAKTSIGLVTSMTPYYVDKGVPLIRNNDIFQNKIRKEKLIRLDYEFDQLNKNRRLFTNDIVTVHTGNIGASAVIDEELNGCQGFATLNTRIKNQNEISSSFLCWYYNSTRNIKYALSMATGDGRSNYNLKDFNKATIPVPSLPEQTKIAAFLTAADNKIEQVGKQFDESKQFKKALLQQMFV